jgi:YggT family protein
VTGVLSAFAVLRDVLRVVLLWSALIIAAIAVLDWLVRTRRVNPFGSLGRFTRQYIDPLLAPVERRVVRAGGLPASAPWWALGAVFIGGILLLGAVDFLYGIVVSLYRGFTTGPSGLFVLLVSWGFGLLQIAILVRVIASWLPVSPFSPWLRWSFTLSEPLLRPLRRFIPLIGSIDITPIVAFFLISIVQSIVVGAIR